MRQVLAAVCLAVLLGGCKFGPDLPPPRSLALPERFSEGTTGSIAPSAPDRWWHAFQDPTLDAIAVAGLRGNLDIAQARARLAAAEAGITVAGAGAFPAITLGVSHESTRETGSMKTVDGTVRTTGAGADAQWVLDVFGGTRAQTESATAARDAARAGTEVARLALLSGLVSAYLDARYFQERMAIAEAALASRQRTLALTRRMKAEGIASDLDVLRAEDGVQAMLADLPVQEAGFRRAAHRLSTLTGQPAASLVPTLMAGAHRQPLPAFDAQAGLPADLLRNRPDVRRAESELAAAMADIGVAWAQLFPTVTLSGSITPSYVHSSAKAGSLTTWSFGPTLTLPIFDGGRLRANVRAAIARSEEKRAGWRAAVLQAIEEVENGITAYHRDRIALRALDGRVAAAERAARLSRSAYTAGMSSMLEVLDAERALYDARSALAASRRNLAAQFVAVNVAMGRGLSGPGSACPGAPSSADAPCPGRPA